MTGAEFTLQLEQACRLEVPYTERLPRAGGIPASVLLLWACDEAESERDPLLLITRRTETVEKHKGQMAFPGGMRESGESDIEAALRETEEEVGIGRDKIRIIGRLPEFATVTDFTVTPLVGILTETIAQVPIQFSRHEIAETLWVPLSRLQSNETYRREWVQYGAVKFPVHAYYVGPHRIWGATGSMIQNLLARLNAIREQK